MARTGPPRAVAWLVVAALLVAACGGAATPTPAPTPSPTAAPTPTPTATDVAAAFVVNLAAAQSGRLPLSGTVAFDTTEATLDGTIEVAGKDSATTLVFDVGGTRQTQDSIRIGAQRWTREQPGPWVLDPEPVDDAKSLAAFLATVTSLEDAGVVTKDGRELHRLVPPAGTTIPPDALGLDPSIENPTVTVEFWAEPDGTPAFWTIGVAWTPPAGDGTTSVELVMDVDLSGLGTPVEIAAPADAWQRYVSSRFAYSIAHPQGWRVVEEENSDILALEDEAFIYVAPQSVPGYTLERFTEELIAFYERELGATAESNDPSTLGGEPARFVKFHLDGDTGRLFLADTIAVRGDTGWEVYLLNKAGTEESDLEALGLFLSTFEFRE